MNPFTSPHARARRLIDRRLDEEPLSKAEQLWLDRHLDRCSRCRDAAEGRQLLLHRLKALPRAAAPVGFAARVRFAAERSVHGESARAREQKAYATSWWWTATAVAAVLLFAVGVQVGGSGGTIASFGAAAVEPVSPHFVVKTPGAGAALVRARAAAVAASRRGTVEHHAADGVLVRLPRQELLGLVAELEQRGGVLVELVEEPSADELRVLFAFD